MPSVAPEDRRPSTAVPPLRSARRESDRTPSPAVRVRSVLPPRPASETARARHKERQARTEQRFSVFVALAVVNKAPAPSCSRQRRADLLLLGVALSCERDEAIE